MPRIPHTRIPYPLRITAYLRRVRGPRHYTAIARHIKAPYRTTARACNRMNHDGRLRWVKNGTYALPVQAGRT
jgi:DNA-binding IclR family transcriptional regulator